MEKFTIADKQDAQHILENNPSLSQEDKDILSKKPVFNVLASLFRKYYDLELLSPYDAGKSIFILGSRVIDKYKSNESYVSMIPYNDYLVLPQEEKEIAAPIIVEKLQKTIKKSSKEFLDENEVEEIDQFLHSKIEWYINENIANWTEMCECDEEGEALEFFLDQHVPSWRVRKDGTVDVIVEGESRESFNFEWEDEEGEKRTSNALDLLQGNVSHEFNDDCNNNFTNTIKDEVISLFE